MSHTDAGNYATNLSPMSRQIDHMPETKQFIGGKVILAGFPLVKYDIISRSGNATLKTSQLTWFGHC